MSTPRSRRSSTPLRSFGTSEPALDGGNNGSHEEPSAARRILATFSLSNLRHGRPSFGTSGGEREPLSTPNAERAPIPTMMQPAGEVYATPLPKLSMTVLSITMLGEFLCANVSTPFLLFMVKGFGEFADEAEVAFWTGILVAMFFLTQFLTSLLWATVAEKHGRRIVLMISLLGSALTCLIFGTSTTLQQAICIRLLQGVFAGAVGVARGCVAFVTDPSNEGRAYAILGFCWGFGGVAGAIIGGAFERPAVKWPDVFGDVQLFIVYPYLLPCALAAAITFSGSVLSLFLDRDGGPREGAIRLPPEKNVINPPIPEEEPSPPTPIFEDVEPRGIAKLKRKISRRLSEVFSKRVSDIHNGSESPLNQPALPLSLPSTQLQRTRTFSRTSKVNGSAYGYSGTYRSRLASNATSTARRGSLGSYMRRRRGSNLDGVRDSVTEGSDLNFAQRLLLANENAVNNIADLWVAAAMNVDNEDPFESDSDIEEQGEEAEDVSPPGSLNRAEGPGQDVDPLLSMPPTGISGPMSDSSPIAHLSRSHRPSSGSASSLQPSRLTPSTRRPSTLPHRPSVTFSPMSPGTSRRPSTPAIFAHPGVKTPSAVLDAQQLLMTTDLETTPLVDPLAPINESHAVSQADVESLAEKTPSLASQLPIVVIIQYGVMALHTTTHDQIFMSYLVSDYESGGLNLNAGHFAQLIALMCLAQIAYQFYLYPNIGPPRGRFSHLAMFRIGTLMFIPAYLTVILYRPFANRHSDDFNPFLMFALSVSTAVRYCGTTFGYTAISILLNYMTPPNAVGYANGIAQSIVSLARCVGPVIGGYLWSVGVEKSPSGYYLGFVVCAAVCSFTVLQSFLIR